MGPYPFILAQCARASSLGFSRVRRQNPAERDGQEIDACETRFAEQGVQALGRELARVQLLARKALTARDELERRLLEEHEPLRRVVRGRQEHEAAWPGHP